MRSLQELKPFVPAFYGERTSEEGKSEIGLENLLGAAPNASFMDIKLGTSTITLNTLSKGQGEIARRTAKDKKSTTPELGFIVCGYCQKDPRTGDIVSNEFKLFPPKEGVEPVFRKVFIKNAESQQVDLVAVDRIIEQLQLLQTYLTTKNEH